LENSSNLQSGMVLSGNIGDLMVALRQSGIEPATVAKVMRRAEIVARVRSGESPASVAAALRVTNDTVRNACRIAGVPCRIPRDAHYRRKTDILSARQAAFPKRRK